MNKDSRSSRPTSCSDVDYDAIDVVAPAVDRALMAEFTDGATIAQLSMPDMRLLIGYMLAYPIGSARRSGRWT